MSLDKVKIKSNFNFKLLSKQSSYKFCLGNSLGVISIKVFINLRKDYVTIKVGSKSVWKGNIVLDNKKFLDFTKPNLEIEEELPFKSVDGVIQHYTQDLTKRVSNLKGDKNEKEKDDDIDMEELEDKLEKFISQ